MGSYKLSVTFLVLWVALCAGVAIDTRISDSYNIDQCDPANAKTPLLETNIYEPARFLGIQKRTINFPESGLNEKKISCIKVMNMDTENHGGYPVIDSGGVGSTDVQIRLTSQLGQSLNFRIEIWSSEVDPPPHTID